MINEEVFSREQIVREVTPVGNGAHIFAPKEWMGEKVVILRTPKPSLKKRILGILEPHLENILGVYFYGSYARGEQRQDSDIDILIISNKNFKIKEKGFEIIVLKKDKIREAIKIAPLLIYSALMEARPLINSELLENLRKNYKTKARDFKEYIRETKDIIGINEELFSPYSIVLRLRGIYIIERLLAGKNYSYDAFKKWVFKDIKNIKDKKVNFNDIYGAYLRIKGGFRVSARESDLRPLLLILKNKTQELEKKLNG
jgi:predicted nucleotidyltransferase